jgi:hypothetical protein
MYLAHASDARERSPAAASPFRGRSGISTLEITIAVLLVALVVMVGYRFRPGHERSPFALFGARPGMSLAELRQIVTKDHVGTVNCRKELDVYQYCVVKFNPDPGFVSAVVDPDGRVVVVHAVAVMGLDGLETESGRAQGEWNGVAQGVSVPPLVEISDTGAVRWSSPNKRWTAELHYSGYRDPDVPTQVILVDSKGVAALASRSHDGAERARRSGWLPPTAGEALAAYEANREGRVASYGDMLTTLTILRDHEAGYWSAHHAYADNASELDGMFVAGATNLEILTATDSGWTARTTHPSFPGLSCVAYGGHVPAADWPVTAHGKRITWVEGSVCDALPPMVAPSLGRTP